MFYGAICSAVVLIFALNSYAVCCEYLQVRLGLLPIYGGVAFLRSHGLYKLYSGSSIEILRNVSVNSLMITGHDDV